MPSGLGFRYRPKRNFIELPMALLLVKNVPTHGDMRRLMASMEILIFGIGTQFPSRLIHRATVPLVSRNLLGMDGSGQAHPFIRLKGSNPMPPIPSIQADSLMTITSSSKADPPQRHRVYYVGLSEIGFARGILMRMRGFAA